MPDRTPTQVGPASSAGTDLAGPGFVAELLEALDKDITVEQYLAGRATGASHAELLEAHFKLALIDPYLAARTSGATHQEVFAVVAWCKIDISATPRDVGSILGSYAKARTVGAAHAECREVIHRPSDLSAYAKARAAGATHQEVREVLAVKMCLNTTPTGVAWARVIA